MDKGFTQMLHLAAVVAAFGHPPVAAVDDAAGQVMLYAPPLGAARVGGSQYPALQLQSAVPGAAVDWTHCVESTIVAGVEEQAEQAMDGAAGLTVGGQLNGHVAEV